MESSPLRFVTVRNHTNKQISLPLSVVRSNISGPAGRLRIVLPANKTVDDVLYTAVEKSSKWKKLISAGWITYKDTDHRPTALQVDAKAKGPIEIAVRVRKRPPKGRRRTRVLRLVPGKRSRYIRFNSIIDKQGFKSLLRKRAISARPVAPMGRSSWAWGGGTYLGDDRVYICYDCGRPIVFRGSPPVPVHV